jgi:hypothetical protein
MDMLALLLALESQVATDRDDKVMVTRKSDDTNANLRFAVRLLISHPVMDTNLITRELKLEPHLIWLAGTKRRTPAGASLPGKNKLSKWSYSFDVLKTRSFSKTIDLFLAQLESHSKLFSDIAISGGSTSLILELDGSQNIGDVFSHKELRRLSNLQIDFGIEVFPQFGPTRS